MPLSDPESLAAAPSGMRFGVAEERGSESKHGKKGIVTFGVRLLQTPLERTRPLDVRISLVATLFGRASNVLTVTLAALVCGLAAYWRGGQPIALVFTTLEVSLLLLRYSTILAFKSRLETGLILDVDAWLVGFGIAAIGSSILWGALCFICLAFSHDPVLYVLPVLSAGGTAGAVAARNSSVPRLARIQLFCSLVPVMAGSVLADDRGYSLLLILTPAMLIGLLMLVAERNQQVVAFIVSQRELARLSRTDPLTEVANRRHFADCLVRVWRRSELLDRPFSVLMVDVDHFKAFNDHHGHPAGDVCLQNIARILETSLRSEGDVVARYGGEEFAVLLEDVDLAAAEMIATRLCAAVAAWGQRHGSRSDGVDVVTISCGVASTTERHRDAESLVKAADEALYRAKRLGRNRVAGPHAGPKTRAA